jgi:SulP family sulfate permease
MQLKKYIPILEWLPQYKKSYIRGDVVAGLTVGVLLIPQGMAYGLLAGLPPIYGLYASIIPLFLYAFLGTSRQLSVGPTALVSLLVLSGIGAIAKEGTIEFASLAIATALFAGAIQILLGIFRLGFLINFLSHPVISGFTSAAAVIIGFSQLKNLLGIEIGRSNLIHIIIAEVWANLSQINYPTLFVGLCSIAFILILQRISKAIPGALIAVIVGALIVKWTGLEAWGVAIFGDVPKGLPSFIIPDLHREEWGVLLPLALTVCLISFIESLAIAKTIESKHKDYRVIPNQELIALGVTKIGAAFFQSYPTTGSFTRSAVNDQSGANTGLSSMISAVLVAFTLLFLTPLFFYVPKVILAAIIVVAVKGLIDYKEAIHLWRKDRRDFLTLLATFIITLTLGIQNGVLAGVLLSLAIMVYQNSRPHIATLGRLNNGRYFRNVNRYEGAEVYEDIQVVRFDAQLYFGNADYFREKIEDMVNEKGEKLKLFILEASSIHDIDSSGIHILKEVITYLHARHIELNIVSAIGPVRDIMYKNGIVDMIGQEHYFFHVHDAIESFRSEQQTWNPNAVQTNLE